MLKALQTGLVGPEEPILVINTGSGLKDIKAAMQAVKAAPVIEPSMAALKKHLQQVKGG
jgi:threonine synthase